MKRSSMSGADKDHILTFLAHPIHSKTDLGATDEATTAQDTAASAAEGKKKKERKGRASRAATKAKPAPPPPPSSEAWKIALGE